MALDYQKARELASYLAAKSRPATRRHEKAVELLAMLEPPLTMVQILDRIPGDSVTERARQLGVSRQAYYHLRSGMHLPSADTRARLAQLTGVPERAIRELMRHD